MEIAVCLEAGGLQLSDDRCVLEQSWGAARKALAKGCCADNTHPLSHSHGETPQFTPTSVNVVCLGYSLEITVHPGIS